MRKITIFLSLLFGALGMNAQEQELLLTLTADAGKRLNFDVCCSELNQTLYIDWGDEAGQQPQENISNDSWEPSSIHGTVGSSGLVSIYKKGETKLTYFNATAFAGESTEDTIAKISAVSFSAIPDLTDLTIKNHNLTSIDLSALSGLSSLDLENNQIALIDLTNNLSLSSLTLSKNRLTSIDVTKLALLRTLYLNDNSEISEILFPEEKGVLVNLYANNLNVSGDFDLHEYAKLAAVSFQNCHLTSLNLSGLNLTNVFCQNNRLTDLKVGTVRTNLNCSGNCLSLDALPVKGATTRFTYAPQAEYVLPEAIEAGGSIDLSAMTSLQGILEEAAPSTFTWKYAADSSVVDASKYTAADGVFTFPEAMDSIFCEISTTAFPDFAGNNAFTTTPVSVKEKGQGQVLLLTLTADAGKRLNFDVCCSELNQTLYIDWGDEAGQQPQENISNDSWEPSSIHGTVGSSGLVSIYKKGETKLTYFNATAFAGESTEDTIAKISAVSFSAIPDLTDLTIKNHNLTSIDLSALSGLSSLDLENNQIALIDLTNNLSLSSLTLSKNRLTSIDVTKLALLRTLYLNDNSEISEILFPEEKGVLVNLYANNLNVSGDFDLHEYAKLAAVSFQNCHLTSLNLSGLNLTNVFCQNNRLTDLKVGTVRTNLNCSGNCLSLDALPVKGATTRFTYAPQAEYVLPEAIEAGGSIDLSAMTSLQGILEEAAPSTFTWKYAADSSVVDASKYTAADGVFTFPEAMDSIFCEISTTAFPDFAGNNAFTTTPVSVKASSAVTSIQEHTVQVTASDGCITVTNVPAGTEVRIYNTAGQLLAAKIADGNIVFSGLAKGIYFVNAGSEKIKVGLN